MICVQFRPETPDMPVRFAAALLSLFLTMGMALAQSSPTSLPLPKVRTVTAFIRLERQTYRTQVADALKMLRAAKSEFTKAGYEVETIRITTQPFPEFTKGLSPDQALDFFREYDKLAQQEGFTPDIGPAMSKDNDDSSQQIGLAGIIASTQSING